MSGAGSEGAGPTGSPAGAQPPPNPNPMRRLLGRGSVYTLGTALETAGVALTLPIITRILSPEQFGEVATALVIAAIVAYLGPLGVTAALARIHFDGEHGPAQTRALLLWAPLISAGVALVVDLLGPLWAPAFGTEYTTVLRFAVWSAVPNAGFLAAQAALIAQDRPTAMISITVLSTVGAQLLAIVAIGPADLGPAGYMGGFFVGRLLAAVIGLSLAGATLKIADFKLLRDGVRLGLPTVTHSIAMYLLNAGDRLVIASISGLAAVGRYQIAYVIGALGIMVQFAFNSAWGPMIYSQGVDTNWDATLSATSNIVYRLAALLASTLAIVAPVGLAIAAPPSYDLASLAPVAAIVSFSGLPLVAYSRSVTVLFQLKRTQTLAYAAPVAVGLNVAANFALVPVIGLSGAALATVGALILLAAIVRRAAGRLHPIAWNRRVEAGSWAFAGILVAVAVVLPATGTWIALRVGIALTLGALFLREVRGATVLSSGEPLRT